MPMTKRMSHYSFLNPFAKELLVRIILSSPIIGKTNNTLGSCRPRLERKAICWWKRNEDIVLSVENIVFDKDELYFVIQIKNNSTLDYDLNFLNLSIETRQKGKKKSLQKLYQEPLFQYNVPSRIAKNETVRLVYVLSKFSLSNECRAVLELNERDGERNLKLKIAHRVINNPN